MKQEQALSAFLALSNSLRLDIIRALVKAGPNGLLAGDISETIGTIPSKTSFHLTALAKAGLVSFSRQSREITYSVDFKTMGALMHFLLEDCCANNQAARNCCFGDKDCC